MCLRKVVRSRLFCGCVPVFLTGLGIAAGGFGEEPRKREGTEEESRGCVEGVAPRRLGHSLLPRLM